MVVAHFIVEPVDYVGEIGLRIEAVCLCALDQRHRAYQCFAEADVADYQHADDEFGIDRGATKVC